MFTTTDSSLWVLFFVLLTGLHRSHSQGNDLNWRTQRSPTGHFNYKNPEEWALDFPTCSGLRQSPVDLKAYGMARLDVPSPLRWQGYERMPKTMTLQNNGHSVELAAAWDDDSLTPKISGGVLDGEYAFAQLHFHWGPRNNVGSEHTINNHSFPLELHMVHYKKEYGSFSDALKHDDGLAVVGVLFQIGIKRNHGISELQRYASRVNMQGSKVKINPFPLSAFKVRFSKDYAAYSGSLTTPPCSEIVTWIIPGIPRILRPSQMKFFRHIQLADGDDHNYRPTFPRNGRMLYYIG